MNFVQPKMRRGNAFRRTIRCKKPRLRNRTETIFDDDERRVRAFPREVRPVRARIVHGNAEPACAAFRQIQRLFAVLAAAYEREISRQTRRVVCDIQRYVDMNYSDHELNLNSVTQRFGLQLSQLSQAFKKTVGVNFSTYLEALRIDKACEYLSAGMPVKQAAESVGYNSVYVFRKAFVRKKSMLPGDYCSRRQTMQGQEEFQ